MRKTNKKYIPFIIVMIVIVLFFTIRGIIDLRVQGLADIIRYEAKDFQSLSIVSDIYEIGEDQDDAWVTENRETLEELLGFLSQYEVKKISENQFQERNDGSSGFEFTITHSKKNPVIMWLFEERLHIYVGEYYEVINGPINMEWLRDFHEEHQTQKE